MDNIVFLDIATITILLVLAYLSKRLGEALKTPAYYKLFYVGSGLIVVAAFINTLLSNNLLGSSQTLYSLILMTVRFICGLVAVVTCLQYWKWLFSEFFNK